MRALHGKMHFEWKVDKFHTSFSIGLQCIICGKEKGSLFPDKRHRHFKEKLPILAVKIYLIFLSGSIKKLLLQRKLRQH